jgi:exosome complex component RRP40
MSPILPGELVEPAQHVNLKLGPGLLQLSGPKGSGPIISIRAGELNHSSNGKKWWIDSNSRRVCVITTCSTSDVMQVSI